MNDRDVSEFEAPDAENGNGDSDKVQEPTVMAQAETKEKIIEEVSVPQPKRVVSQENKESDNIFVAPLAGFGTLHAASTFANRVRKFYSGVKVKKRISKTPKGKTIAWYQAVTGEFDERKELERIIKQIKVAEHIKDIKIIEKRKVVRS